MVLPAIALWLSLAVDRAFGDPSNSFHPTAYLGRFIGWWGRPSLYPVRLQRALGVLFCLGTASLYALPFGLFGHYAPALLFVIAGPVLLKVCFAWRCLEEHVTAVSVALGSGMEDGRGSVQMLVSRDTSDLGEEGVLSAAYESMAENLVDSITSPLLFFTAFGLGGAAFFRAVNTMDAMLGYRDERIRLGWCAARLDDLLNFIPARITGIMLLIYFAAIGRFRPAWRIFRRDAGKRAGFNGGIPMSLIAGGVGVRFEKPGAYRLGDPERTLAEAGSDIVKAVRVTTIITAVFCTLLFFCTLFPLI